MWSAIYFVAMASEAAHTRYFSINRRIKAILHGAFWCVETSKDFKRQRNYPFFSSLTWHAVTQAWTRNLC